MTLFYEKYVKVWSLYL